MQIYNNLDKDVQRLFLARLGLTLISLIFVIYSITVLSLRYKAYWLIFIIITHAISILHNCNHIWTLVETNKFYDQIDIETDKCRFSMSIIDYILIICNISIPFLYLIIIVLKYYNLLEMLPFMITAILIGIPI